MVTRPVFVSFPAGLLLALLGTAVPSRAADIAACPSPASFVTPTKPLPHLAAAIVAGGPVQVLAIGSATTTGLDPKDDPGDTFPYHTAETLRSALPHVPVVLSVRGGRGMTAEAMLPLLRDAVRQQPVQLVLWQTGTVEAVRGLRTDALRAVLLAGRDAVREAGGDLVLIDPQYSRLLTAKADLDPYEETMLDVAASPDVSLFHRLDLTRHWVDTREIDLERAPKLQRETVGSLLSRCLGEALATFARNGAELVR